MIQFRLINTKIKRISILMFILLVILTININVSAGSKDLVTLKRCIDGDTAIFSLNNEEIKVRFLAVDTPESVHPKEETTLEGISASKYTCDKLTNAFKIELEYDPKSTITDKYKRTLAWIWVDNYLLQKDLIEKGYAEVKYIYDDYLYVDDLYSAEKAAIEDKIGIWENAVTYVVTFDEGIEQKYFTVKENTKVNEYSPVKSGYNFVGWYLNDDKFDFSTPITNNILLKAKFEKDLELIKYLLLAILIYIAYITNNKKLIKKIKKAIK